MTSLPEFGKDVEIRPDTFEEITTMKTEVIEEYWDEPEMLNVTQINMPKFFMPHENEINLMRVKGSPMESSDLKNRQLKEEGLEGYKYECGLCSLEFREEKYLTNHYMHCPLRNKELKRDRRNGIWKLQENMILNKQKEVAGEIGERFKCEICGYAAKNNYYYQRHILVHSDEKPFRCITCGKSFRRNSSLEEHIVIHDSTRERRVLCPYCDEAFYRKSALTRHIHVKHPDYLKHKCDLCEYTTTDEALLKRHIFLKHSITDNRYRCEYCEYSTDNKTRLTTHSRVHSNTKPFKCTYKICKCTELQEESCECTTCEFATAHESTLRKHVLQRHSIGPKKYNCTVCKYSTHIKGDLTAHLRIHTNEKPFKCGYQNCTYRSARREHLKIHIRHRHTREKRFHCDKCEYTCVSSCNLKRHITFKHNET